MGPLEFPKSTFRAFFFDLEPYEIHQIKGFFAIPFQIFGKIGPLSNDCLMKDKQKAMKPALMLPF